MKEDKKNILIGVLIGIIIVLVGILIYVLVIKKEEPVHDNSTNELVTEKEKLEHVLIGDKNTDVVVNGKTLKLRLDDNSTLYINDVKQENVQFEGNLFVTNKYALITSVGQYGYGIDYAINENGEIVSVHKIILNKDYYTGYQVGEPKLKEGKIVAEYVYEECKYITSDMADNCEKYNAIVEFSYDGKNVIMKETAIPEKTTALTQFLLNKKDSEVIFNGNNIKIKYVYDNGNLYINDKIVKSFDYDNIYAYVTDKLILIEQHGGQCGSQIIGAINEKNEYIEIAKNNYTSQYDIHIEGDKIVAKATLRGEVDLCSGDVENIEIVYDGSSLVLKKMD